MKTSLTFLGLLLTVALNAQVRLVNQVLSPAGFESTGSMMASSTLGETATGFTREASTMIHSGFQQQYSESPTPVLEVESLHITLYPNPVHDVLSFELAGELNNPVQYTILDALGVIQSSGDLDQRRSIWVTSLAAGNYIVRLVTREGVGSVKIQKI